MVAIVVFDDWHAVVYGSALLLSCVLLYVVSLNRNLRRAKSGLEREIADRLRTQEQLAENESRLR
jgi:hypothetical protein